MVPPAILSAHGQAAASVCIPAAANYSWALLWAIQKYAIAANAATAAAASIQTSKAASSSLPRTPPPSPTFRRPSIFVDPSPANQIAENPPGAPLWFSPLPRPATPRTAIQELGRMMIITAGLSTSPTITLSPRPAHTPSLADAFRHSHYHRVRVLTSPRNASPFPSLAGYSPETPRPATSPKLPPPQKKSLVSGGDAPFLSARPPSSTESVVPPSLHRPSTNAELAQQFALFKARSRARVALPGNTSGD